MSSELSLSLEHSVPIINVAAYKFFRWDRLEKRRDELKSLCYRLQLRGTILLSGEGINLFLAGSRESVDGVLNFLHKIPEVGSLQVKESVTDGQVCLHAKLMKALSFLISVSISKFSACLREFVFVGPRVVCIMCVTNHCVEISCDYYHSSFNISFLCESV